MEHEIGIWFLLLSLVFPRGVLFIWWLTGNLPYNTTPFLGDIICSVLFPRVLVLVYIYGIQGVSGWFIIHLIVMFITYAYHIANYEQNMEKAKEILDKYM